MKTSKALALASGLGIALVSATAFAGNSDHSDHEGNGVGKGKNVVNRVAQMKMHTGSGMHMGSGAMRMGSGMHRPGEGMAFSGFLRTDFTTDETVALKVLLDAHKNEVQSLFASGSTLTQEERQTKIATLHTAFINSLLPYVIVSKQEEFKTKFAEMKTPEDRKEMHEERQEMREQRQEVRQEARGQRQENRQEARSERQATRMDTAINKILDTKLAKFSTDAEKLAWLGNITAKVDAVLVKISSAKTKETLQALKDLVGERVDALNGTTSESVIESILQ